MDMSDNVKGVKEVREIKEVGEKDAGGPLLIDYKRKAFFHYRSPITGHV
jgi:hypothetical protein